jgi:hypothetical protein
MNVMAVAPAAGLGAAAIPAAAVIAAAVNAASEIRKICEKAGGDAILSDAFEGIGLTTPHLITSVLGGIYCNAGVDPATVMAGKISSYVNIRCRRH